MALRSGTSVQALQESQSSRLDPCDQRMDSMEVQEGLHPMEAGQTTRSRNNARNPPRPQDQCIRGSTQALPDEPAFCVHFPKPACPPDPAPLPPTLFLYFFPPTSASALLLHSVTVLVKPRPAA